MKRTGVIGLGNMGLGMARNLLKADFAVAGFDVRPERRALLTELGGAAKNSSRAVGTAADMVFVMVLNGSQLLEVLNGQDGLLSSLKAGATVAVSATVKPRELRQAARLCDAARVRVLDCPVSGGQSGAEEGTLTLMVAGPEALQAEHRDALDAVGERILNVGETAGQGQTVKAALQALIGATFAALFEALVLGSKAGVSGAVMQEVFGASHASSPLIRNCIEKIRARTFADTGSHIATIYKDLTISMDLARQTGASMFVTAAAMELMQAGIAVFPDEDNWAAIKLLERIADTEVH